MSEASKDAIWRSRGIRAAVLPVLLLLISMISVVVLWRWLKDPQNLPIKQVKISTSYQHVTQSQLQEVITPYLSRGFVAIPIAELRDSLEQLVWVNHVAIQRIWPDTLRIQLSEQRAVARWGRGGVLNPDGALFYPEVASISPDLPLLVGPADLHQSIFQHYQLLQSLLEASKLRIEAVQVSDRRSWQIQLDNHVTVVLGDKDHRLRIKRFIKALPKLKEKLRQSIHQVDLRYPNGLAVS